jgi:hypothetical protein
MGICVIRPEGCCELSGLKFVSGDCPCDDGPNKEVGDIDLSMALEEGGGA